MINSMIKRFFLIGLFFSGALHGIQESAPRGVPLVLSGKYSRLEKRLSEATVLDAGLRAEAQDLISRLRAVGGEREAQNISQRIQALEQRMLAPAQAQPVVEQSAHSNIIPVRVSKLFAQGKPEEINLDDTEPISGETFRELLEKQQKHGDPFIIARVVTASPCGRNVSYYDAYQFNKWRFGMDYPLKHPTPLEIRKSDNPSDSLPIQGEIQYFTYQPEEHDLGFQYSFAENELRNNAQTRLLVDLHQNENLARKAEAKLRYGLIYFFGEGVQRDYKRASEYLEQVAQDTHASPEARSDALGCLGVISYQGGVGVEKNYARAQEYFEQFLATPAATPAGRAKALENLGVISYQGGFGVERNYARAQKYFEQYLASPAATPQGKAAALGELGFIYIQGGFGVEKNYARAQEYLEQYLASPGAKPLVRASALYNLGFIYGQGGFGVEKNYARAQEYLEQYLASPAATPEARAEALFNLGVINYLGDVGVERNYVHAQEYFKQVLASPAATPKRRAQAQKYLAEIEKLKTASLKRPVEEKEEEAPKRVKREEE